MQGPLSPVAFVSDDVVPEECAEQVAATFDEWLAISKSIWASSLPELRPRMSNVRRWIAKLETASDRVLSFVTMVPQLFKKD